MIRHFLYALIALSFTILPAVYADQSQTGAGSPGGGLDVYQGNRQQQQRKQKQKGPRGGNRQQGRFQQNNFNNGGYYNSGYRPNQSWQSRDS